MHILKYVEWQSESGLWFCNDTAALASWGSKWWAPARMLSISPAEFVQLLYDKFHPDMMQYSKETDTLIYAWKSQTQMRLFKNWLNAQARKYNFLV